MISDFQTRRGLKRFRAATQERNRCRDLDGRQVSLPPTASDLTLQPDIWRGRTLRGHCMIACFATADKEHHWFINELEWWHYDVRYKQSYRRTSQKYLPRWSWFIKSKQIVSKNGQIFVRFETCQDFVTSKPASRQPTAFVRVAKCLLESGKCVQSW